MSGFLRQSTASQEILFGPFHDPSDGVTPVTVDATMISKLDHASTGIMVSKNGGNLAIRHATVTATTAAARGGYAIVTLDATDTATPGNLVVEFDEAATTTPVWQEYSVVTANVYDTLFSTDKLEVDITQVTGNAVVATGINGALKVDVHAWNGTAIPGVDTAGYPKVTIKDGTGQGELNITSGATDANTTTWAGAALPTLASTSDIWGYATRTLSAPTNITSNDAEITLGSDNKVTISADVHTANVTVKAVTDAVTANVTQISGDSTAADNAEAFFDGTGYAGTNNVIPTVTSVTGIAAGGITATSIDSDAITAEKIADGAIDAGAIATTAAEKVADTVLDRDMSTGTDSGSTTVRTPRQALRLLRNKWGISGGTLTVYAEDDATESWRSTVTQTAGNPVTASNPAGGS